jgi:hypothetical protein
LSRPALVRVSAIMTMPSRTRIPQQYVIESSPPASGYSDGYAGTATLPKC